MSEYMEKFSVSRLLGAPPGYVGYEEGGQLSEAIRRRPYSVVLLDEIEKAHPDVFNMLLQIMEEGRLTDSFGRHVDFKNTILIMTSNIGADMIKGGQQFGFGKRGEVQDYERIKKTLMGECEKYFRPEFINRIDDTIVFHALSREDITAIVRMMVARLNTQLQDKRIHVEPTEAALLWLVEKGYDATYGARQLRRTIQKHVEDPLAESIVRGQFADGARIEVDTEGDALVFREIQIAEPPPLALAER
jgi:ATP-dependent Clp protease ATP-binding subunit ClpC